MKRIYYLQLFFLTSLFLFVLFSFNLFAAPGDIERVSVDNSGTEGNVSSSYTSISSDGRYVAFRSRASNLVSGDTNGVGDVFVYDRETNTIERVSVADNGTQGDGYSDYPSISSDGRYVAFHSEATNLVPGDTNGHYDIFVYDRQTNTIERVSVADNGTEGNNNCLKPSISSDGRYVAFYSYASNLVSGDTNGVVDIFVYDRQTNTIERVSIAGNGTEGNADSRWPSISSDGRYVAFNSDSSNLVSGDTNGRADIFVYDRQTNTIERVSIANNGTEGNGNSYSPSISSDGRYVAFHSDASNLVPGDTNGVVDIFVYDRQTNTIERVSVADNGTEGNGNSYQPSISSDGRYVAFRSDASNLVPGDTNGREDVFVYNRQIDTIERVSVADNGTEGNADSRWPSISSDGRYVAFESDASNLVPGDMNGVSDIFVKEMDIVSSSTPENVPSLNEYGIIILVLLSGYFAFRKLKKEV